MTIFRRLEVEKIPFSVCQYNFTMEFIEDMGFNQRGYSLLLLPRQKEIAIKLGFDYHLEDDVYWLDLNKEQEKEFFKLRLPLVFDAGKHGKFYGHKLKRLNN